MGLPSIHCVVCGGPFGSPYDELMEGRYPDAGHLQDIKSQELEWLDDIQLFGLPSALQTFHDSASDDKPRSDPKEMPIFLDNAQYNYGAEIVFNVRGIGDLATLCPNQNGDCLFAMHGACASIVRLVCARQTTFTSLRAYYEVLRSAIPYYYDSGGIYWPHDYFGAQTYWGYDEWNYLEGFRKFVTDPLAFSGTTEFVLETLQVAPAPPPNPADATERDRVTQVMEQTSAALLNKPAPLENLPVELIQKISEYVPNRTLLALRLTSRVLANKLPWNQRVCYNRMISGISMPHIWSSEKRTSRELQRVVESKIEYPERQNWKYLTTLLADARTIVRQDPEEKRVPLSLWNRCRIWECVVGVERFMRPSG